MLPSDSTCRLSLDSIQSETKTLNKRLKNSERSVSSSSDDMKEQYLSTIQESLQAVEQLQLLLSSVEEQRKHLSAYLCEDSSSFSLEELFSTIKAFRDLFLRTLKVSANRSAAQSAGLIPCRTFACVI
ncbi:inverted formin-2-like [Haplochromis burtoni]|uniref:inverted formin-2-like n=1 Tax=Haplochromis burtoni TaxID=8153 RepID=UPI001C2DB3F5|nr:inverted formin-2-like [Haplochromis burtoni]